MSLAAWLIEPVLSIPSSNSAGPGPKIFFPLQSIHKFPDMVKEGLDFGVFDDVLFIQISYKYRVCYNLIDALVV